jgi:hypothetical protein
MSRPSSSSLAVLLAGALCAGAALAKLPPLTDEQKAKAAEAAARTAWANKVADYKLCQAMDKVAAAYFASAKAANKEVKPAVATADCTDPGPFVYTPPAPKPIEAAGAHSPPETAKGPPNTTAPAAVTNPTPKKP